MKLAHPHHEGHEVFVIVSWAAAEDIEALVVSRAAQLSNRELHPVVEEENVVGVSGLGSGGLGLLPDEEVGTNETHDTGPWQ